MKQANWEKNYFMYCRYSTTGVLLLTFRKTVKVNTKTLAWIFVSFHWQTSLQDHTRVAKFTKAVIKGRSK